MSEGKRNEQGELMELSHEAVPGFKKAFYVIFALGCLFLAGVFIFGGSGINAH